MMGPSQLEIQTFMGHYNNGMLDDAEKLAISLTKQYPCHPFGWKALVAVMHQARRVAESIDACETAVSLAPGDAEAHNFLGISLDELGRLEEAVSSYKRAISLNADFAEAHNNLGITLKKIRRFELAELSFREAMRLKPDFAEAYYNLGITLKELGRLDEAQENCRQAVTLRPDYASAKHMLAALIGNTTVTAPRDYVEELFDSYAAKFESSLVDNLEYKIPSLIAEIIMKDNKFESLGSIADLGCGTGLFGIEIKDDCERLEGIDLSKNMLDKAKRKNVYTKLIKQSIEDYLSKASLNFDYFISIDVFIYIGDLSELFDLISSRNERTGKLVFSTEHSEIKGYHLEKSGRYSHSKSYIEALCKKYKFSINHFSTADLRKENGVFLQAGIYSLSF